MRTATCAACHLPVDLSVAVQRSDLRTVSAWHRDCFTVARAVAGLEMPAMPLTVRMALAGADARLRG